MRKLVLVGLFFACVAAVPAAVACDARGGGEVQIIITPADTAATQQSQTFLADATRLDGKADIEEAASASATMSAKSMRRKAAIIRTQAFQVSEPSQSALLQKAASLETEATMNDSSAMTFTSRAKLIRSRSKALRALSTRVLASGAVTATVLQQMQLPAPPASHPDRMPLRMLDAAPKMIMRPHHNKSSVAAI